ncbi:hypothetical protein BHE97_12190 [Aeromicrobium sp. PE09-221]|uniref:response regulator transcription factor n=1 Tax=Aeromicrobium sp. PE09-221 TaxID=1898043 RepID=UPI000B3ED1D5|nr:response regulator transcription factor [Aeromicrobium sp. PE09-221]OUZ08886.1 hypothetical protein BHE97_12190 [Aeromicrobium sp. PE09-221]
MFNRHGSASPAQDTAPLSVLVVDDHRVFADLLAYALGHFSDIAEVRIATSATDARLELADRPVDVAVLDVRLGDGSGLDLIPVAMSAEARAVTLTGYPRRAECDRALGLGACAYLAKDASFTTLTTAVLSASNRAPMVVDTFPEDTLAGGNLTPRERDILLHIIDGQDATTIANELSLSVLTVRSHIKSLLSKLGVRSQLEAVALASHSGISAQLN